VPASVATRIVEFKVVADGPPSWKMPLKIATTRDLFEQEHVAYVPGSHVEALAVSATIEPW
jgi:hypothetical protein